MRNLNLKYGEANIDAMLVKFTTILKETISKNASVARIGGDKFMVVDPVSYDYDVIRTKLVNLSEKLSTIDIGSEQVINVKTTIGLVSYNKDGYDYDTLIKKLKTALQRGKNKGGGCFIIYDVNKCGLPTDDVTSDLEFKKDNTNFTIYSIINSVHEILSKDRAVDLNIQDALALIGNYFELDRITVVEADPESSLPLKTSCWSSTKYDSFKVDTHDNTRYLDWMNSMDKDGKIKINQVESNPDHLLYPQLKEFSTSSILSYALQTEGKQFGFISFDMISANRFWTKDEISSLSVIAKNFAILYNNEFAKKLHMRELYIDKDTNIYNSIMFTKTLSEMITKNHSMQYSIITIKLDGYKNVLNKFGPKRANTILNIYAGTLEEAEKNNDFDTIYCRSNEFTFAVFIPTIELDMVKCYIDNLVSYLDTKSKGINGISTRIGIYMNDGTDTLDLAIEKSRLARDSYKALKQSYCFYENEFYENEKFKAELELHMNIAKDSDEFLLYLQPKVDTVKGTVIGAEALTRWYFKHEKILMPYQFIELFENNGFINTLDFLVFENVCKFLRYNMDHNLPLLRISVNVSRYQDDYDLYLNTINAIREKYDVPAKYIEIEITEGMYVNNLEDISKFISMLHGSGYYVSMDDFGSGYSNLASLADLDFDLIKLDKSFCNNKNDEKETVILKFVMNLSKSLNIDALCEGVETVEHMEYLKSIGCTKVQGYLYSKPIPAEEFREKYIYETPKL